MRMLGKTAMVLGVAGTMAIGSITASDARPRYWAAGAAGFAVGAAVGAAAANASAGYYYGTPGYDSYAYSPSYAYEQSYAYEPAYAAPVYTAPSYYGPVVTYDSSIYPGYNTNYVGPWSERRIQGRDW